MLTFRNTFVSLKDFLALAQNARTNLTSFIDSLMDLDDPTVEGDPMAVCVSLEGLGREIYEFSDMMINAFQNTRQLPLKGRREKIEEQSFALNAILKKVLCSTSFRDIFVRFSCLPFAQNSGLTFSWSVLA